MTGPFETSFARWIDRIDRTRAAVVAHGGEITLPFQCLPPVDSATIAATESAINRQIPGDLRKFFQSGSSKLFFAWSLTQGSDVFAGAHTVPKADVAQAVTYGGVTLSLDELRGAESGRRSWVDHLCEDPNNPGNRLWTDSLAFYCVGNGDLLALDSRHGENPPVIYLDHESGDGHGMVLARDFSDFMNRWCELGFPGPEHWIVRWFWQPGQNAIDPFGPTGVQWRKWFFCDDR